MWSDPKIPPAGGGKTSAKNSFLDVSEQMGQQKFSAFGRRIIVAKQGGLVARITIVLDPPPAPSPQTDPDPPPADVIGWVKVQCFFIIFAINF